jgi:hypothetical protein
MNFRCVLVFALVHITLVAGAIVPGASTDMSGRFASSSTAHSFFPRLALCATTLHVARSLISSRTTPSHCTSATTEPLKQVCPPAFYVTESVSLQRGAIVRSFVRLSLPFGVAKT